MSIFQSSNIWKKAARQKKQQENPLTPEQEWRKQFTSTALWLVGGAVLVVLYAAGLQSGAIQMDLTGGVVLAVVSIYTLMNAVQLGRQWKDRPGKK